MSGKAIGHCACCSQFVWDVHSDPQGWTGSRSTMLLADGSHMDVTLCKKCETDPDFDAIWQNVLAGWAAESAEVYAAMQAETNFILSLLYNMSWNVVDLMHFRAITENSNG